MNTVISDKKTIFWLVAPGFILIAAMIFIPIMVSLYYSLTDWDGVTDYRFIGLSNFIEIVTKDAVFWKSLLNALLLGLGLVFVQHPLSVLTAMVVPYCGRFEKLLRASFFIPSIISTFVTTQLWVSVFNTQFGLLNRLLERLGLEAWKQDWLGDPKLAICCMIFVCIWQGFGYAFLLYYAGIKGVPKELYEAAMLDGATQAQVHGHIIFPLLAPVVRVNIILAVVAAFKQMETVYLMTGGGPADSTQFLSTYLYSKAFREGLYGYGNALSILLVLICLIMTVLLNRALQKDVGEY
ncbi:carbohydrate ABC transporter permease [Paenibacillus hexagrammi]|uniref:Sugar ABC transporter permease n=1 Tax=Paenibacillus hexagrammi TaxID=2908839 RepID=A0ABY3SFE6_9BACL|nr:sugar ABC transporter permease [Paenibacillus sp. YPD9-1]UJF31896.1 sugar ABC transporter permease [Paenibacillus sp. YPD9-1]